jgi:tetratricopeptide (TPR) repeat protein
MTGRSLHDLAEALERGDHELVLRETDALLAERPGDDAAHEYRARALLALGRLDEAERHAQDAVRLDPEEIRYRELLADILSREGAHRDAAAEFGRLARNDPRETTWTVAEARERIDAAQPGMGVEAARRAVKLEPRNGQAQLALAQALSRTGDARGAFQAATLATELLPGDPEAREALADAHYLAGQDAAAFDEFRALAGELAGRDRDRVVAKARSLYRRRAGALGRIVAGIGPAFELAFANGWLRIDR